MNDRIKPLSQKGFTIIEMMIAVSIFSVILVMVTVVMIGIGNLFYKGVNQIRVQDNSRSISDDVSQHIQLSKVISPGWPNQNIKAYCIGNTRYTYIIGHRIGDTDEHGYNIKHVLWRDNNPGYCVALDLRLPDPDTGPFAGSDGQELIGPNSRLTAFKISDPPGPFAVQVGVAYGDRDLLLPIQPAIPSATTLNATSNCVSGSGQQYCAAAFLQTTVVQRL